MDCARQTSLFWRDIWNECGREKSGIVYDIMKMCRSKFHYKLRALRKKKHAKTKQSVSKSMLRNHQTTYWKSTSVIRKISIIPRRWLMEYVVTQILQICFAESTSRNLYNSVKSLDEAMIVLREALSLP